MREAVAALLIAASLSTGQSVPRANVPQAKFVGSTPCDILPRQFLQIPAGRECERITWELTLLSRTPQSGTYELRAVYGMQARNAPGFAGGARTSTVSGEFELVTGMPSTPGAPLIRLSAAQSRAAEFAILGEGLIHLLSADRRLMIGNGGWSYTLSAPSRSEVGAMLRRQTIRSGGERAAGVFEGRTPCGEISRELHLTPGRDCAKLKWALTLVENPDGTSGTYKLAGTLYRAQARTGTWSASTSAIGGSVYTLDPGGDGGYMSLVRVDGNIMLMRDRAGNLLTGNAAHSYTLNRVSDARAR